MIELSHPKDYRREQGARFKVEFTKHRNIPGGSAVRSYVTQLKPGGWVIDDGLSEVERRMLGAVRQAWADGEPYRSKTQAADKVPGSRRQAKLEAWEALLQRHLIREVVTSGGRAFQAAA